MSGHRTSWIGGVAFAVAIGFTAPLLAATGTVRVYVAKAGFIVGAGGGKGVLTFEHRNYPFTVQGLSVGLTAGASFSKLVGRAKYIKDVGDFSGTYSVIGGGVALGGGIGGVSLRNDKGVTIHLEGYRAGLEASANITKVVIILDELHSTPD
jgi:lipid-binding SYLF domain-containing protein